MEQDQTGEVTSYVPREAAERVIEAEQEFLGVQAEQSTALAISGGGIRSASFALGVIQALVNGGVMKHIQYLSTVSGGGYLGSALTWFLHNGLPDGRRAGTSPDDFPFGTRDASRVGRGSRRNEILDFIRQNASYLVPSRRLDAASFAAVVLRAMLVSLVVYFALMIWVFALLMRLHVFDDTVPRMLGLEFVPNLLLLSALATAAAFAVFSFSYSLLTRLVGGNGYGGRTFAQQMFGWVAKVGLACVLLGVLPLLHTWLTARLMASTGAASTTLGAVLGLFEFLRRQRAQPSDDGPSPIAALRAVLAAWLVLYGLAFGAYCVAALFTDGQSEYGELALKIVIAVATVFGFVVNVNYLGLHRMYRDRLMELFLPDLSTVRSGKWGLARKADVTAIEDVCRRDGKALLPYHIINTNVVLVDSNSAGFRGRGGDNFILSPLFCGSGATGWCSSRTYMKREVGGRFTGRGMTLPTAMAISGAAVNPNTGVGGRGTTRSRLVSTLMALLNLRLGYWAPHPNRSRSLMARMNVPNFLEPGLRGGVLSGGLREDAAMVQLTDGGHFENLAVYELIRRRVKFIFVCDGAADPKFTFEDLSTLTERVRVDFGAKLSFGDEHFGDGEYGLEHLEPGSAAGEHGALVEKYGLAKRGFAIGRIRYLGDPRDEPSGTIIYIKTTMVADLSADIYGYRSANPSFPDESTGDQFFDEAQFEAYRELGYHLGWQWLEENETRKFWKPPTPSAPPAGGRAEEGAALPA